MKLSFKQYLNEQSANQGLDLAAKMLQLDKNKLVVVDNEEEHEVLETGRELKKQFIKMVHGNLVVRIFKALGKLFARVEYPDGEMKMYTAGGVRESYTPESWKIWFESKFGVAGKSKGIAFNVNGKDSNIIIDLKYEMGHPTLEIEEFISALKKQVKLDNTTVAKIRTEIVDKGYKGLLNKKF